MCGREYGLELSGDGGQVEDMKNRRKSLRAYIEEFYRKTCHPLSPCPLAYFWSPDPPDAPIYARLIVAVTDLDLGEVISAQ